MVTPWVGLGSTGPPCNRPKGREDVDPITREITWTPYSWRDALGREHYLRCESNDCAGCRVINVHRIAGAISLASPTYWLSLTHVGEDPATITRRLCNFRAYVAEVVPGYEHAWAAEENLRQTVIHTHGYAHTGSRITEIPEHVITEQALRAGLGWRTRIGRIEPGTSIEWFKYPMECALDPERVDRFWALNSTGARHRLIHASRGFWRNGPGGPPIRREEAETLAYRRSRLSSGRPNIHLIGRGNS